MCPAHTHTHTELSPTADVMRCAIHNQRHRRRSDENKVLTRTNTNTPAVGACSTHHQHATSATRQYYHQNSPLCTLSPQKAHACTTEQRCTWTEQAKGPCLSLKKGVVNTICDATFLQQPSPCPGSRSPDLPRPWRPDIFHAHKTPELEQGVH